MSEGKWSGDTANRTWVRPGSRVRNVPGDAERAAAQPGGPAVPAGPGGDDSPF